MSLLHTRTPKSFELRLRVIKARINFKMFKNCYKTSTSQDIYRHYQSDNKRLALKECRGGCN